MATDVDAVLRGIQECAERNNRKQRAHAKAQGSPGLYVHQLYVKDIREHINTEGALLIHLHMLKGFPIAEAFRTRKFLKTWGKTRQQLYKARKKLERDGRIRVTKRASNVIDIQLAT